MAFTLPTTLSQWATLSNKEFTNGYDQQLFEWLQSPEGGNLRVRQREGDRYAILYYNKKHSNMALGHVQECRSVVWDTQEGKLACRSVGHSRPLSEITDETVVTRVSELADGVMVNMFWDSEMGSWALATRTCLGATNNFYGSRPFAELFWETFRSMGLTVEHDLKQECYYSWVLQHPEERIVVAPLYGVPKLWLVSSDSYELTESLKSCLPTEQSSLMTFGEVKQFVINEGKRRGPAFQGLTFYTVDGCRYKLRSSEYTRARLLRGNQAKRPYLWLERWGEGQLAQYVELYPEEKCDADATINSFKQATQELYDLYQTVYRRKELPLGQAPHKYRKLLWEAHKANAGAYFPNLRAFMNRQDTARKLWLLNYERRYPASG